jgi:hypothetical protein
MTESMPDAWVLGCKSGASEELINFYIIKPIKQSGILTENCIINQRIKNEKDLP